MTRGRKPKRKNWVEKKEPKGQTCRNCGRKFWPKTERDICLLCLNGVISPKTNGQAAAAERPAKQKKDKDTRTCLLCQRDFDSEGIYNRVCPSCRETNSNKADDYNDSAAVEALFNRWER